MHDCAAHATDTSVGAPFVTPGMPCERPHCREPPASRQAGCQSHDCHRGSFRCRMRPKMHAGVECQAENLWAPMQEGTSDDDRGHRHVYLRSCERADDLVPQAAGPFNSPTELVPAPFGGLYVCDGYRYARGHRIASWGALGKTAPNQFHLPHRSLVGEDGRVCVCDRENSRIQVFSSDGRYLSIWTDIQRPTAISVDAVTLRTRGSAARLLDDLCSEAIWRSCCGKNQRSGAPLLRPAHTSHGRPPEKWRT